jgi:hypothetical protein
MFHGKDVIAFELDLAILRNIEPGFRLFHRCLYLHCNIAVTQRPVVRERDGIFSDKVERYANFIKKHRSSVVCAGGRSTTLYSLV